MCWSYGIKVFRLLWLNRMNSFLVLMYIVRGRLKSPNICLSTGVCLGNIASKVLDMKKKKNKEVF